MENKYDSLLLKNQLCFPLYSASNAITRRYKPLLKELDLTYTQYIVMMVLWEYQSINEKQLVESLYLKSSTLAPLLRRLEEKNYIKIEKSEKDSRSIIISLTNEGNNLRDKALCVPQAMAQKLNLSKDEIMFLYDILYKIIKGENENEC
mgnify:CR=1 FL=1